MLFMKIDANSDGSVDWDEFSAYMVTVSEHGEALIDVLNEKKRSIIASPHKDMIMKIEYVTKERKYISISRDGIICIWTATLKLHRFINTRDFDNTKTCWVQDAKYLVEHNKLVLITDDRQ